MNNNTHPRTPEDTHAAAKRLSQASRRKESLRRLNESIERLREAHIEWRASRVSSYKHTRT